MLKLVDKTYREDTNELIASFPSFEGEIICWNRKKVKSDIMKEFIEKCDIAQSLVNQTSNNQEILDYWWNHVDDYIRHHKLIYEESGCDINKCLRKSLNYFVRIIQLVDDDKIIDEKTFRYGAL